MPSEVTVKVKVPPYLKKYILAQSVNKQEPAIFERKHIYNISLIHKVTNYNRLTSLPVDERDNVMDYFYNRWKTFEAIQIQLPFNERKDVRYFNYLSVNNKYAFVKEVKEDFYFEISRFLIREMRKRTERKVAIHKFLQQYNITEDDVQLETIYRQTSRILEPML